MIHHGDCLEVMAGMDPESVDAIVTDPPYGLGFMGKAWDDPGGADQPMRRRPELDAVNAGMSRQGGRQWRGEGGQRRQARDMRTYQAWCEEWGRAMYRVAKPSSYLLAFGGTRTVHRMTVALEDAGWIIRDMLVWGYASGFPKSKASLKPAWEPIVMARKPGPLRMLAIDECRIPTDGETIPRVTGKGILGGSPEGGYDRPWKHDEGALLRRQERADAAIEAANTLGRWPANIVLTDPIFDGGVEGVVGGGETVPLPERAWTGAALDGAFAGIGGAGIAYHDSGTYSRFFTIPQDATMCSWCGAKSATGSSDPDEPRAGSARSRARTEASSADTTRTASPTTSATEPTSWLDESGSTSRNGPSQGSQLDEPSRSGRASRADPRSTSSDTTTTTRGPWMCASCADDAMRFSMAEQASAERNYSWAYLIPKADRADREPVLGGLTGLPEAVIDIAGQNTPEGRIGRGVDPIVPTRRNVHPTVKPTDLMRHLVRLVTPTGGVVLDPFLGSGTTGIAAEMEGFAWIGIEREAEYVAIAEARLNGTQRGLGLETA